MLGEWVKKVWASLVADFCAGGEEVNGAQKPKGK